MIRMSQMGSIREPECSPEDLERVACMQLAVEYHLSDKAQTDRNAGPPTITQDGTDDEVVSQQSTQNFEATATRDGMAEQKSVRKVWRKSHLKQKDYIVIERWAVLANGFAIISFYCILYTCCALLVNTRDPKNYDMPWGDNEPTVVLITVTSVCITLTFITVPTGICLIKWDHPLVKARGVLFVAGVGLTATLVSVLQYYMMLTYFIPTLWHTRKHHVYTYFSYAEYVIVTGTLALIVVREGVIYLIFIQQQYRRRIPHHRFILKIVCGIFLLSIVCFLPYLLATHLSWEHEIYYTLFVLIPWEVAIAMLAYYSYQTRKVSSSFSDWKSNFRIGIVLAVANNLIVLSMVIDFGAPVYGVLPTPWNLFLFYFASMAKIAYTVLDLFSLLSVIALRYFKICEKLSPKTSTYSGSAEFTSTTFAKISDKSSPKNSLRTNNPDVPSSSLFV